MTENQQNKIKVVDIFHGKPVSQNSEKSSICSKLGFEKGVILNAISSSHEKKNLKTEMGKENEKKNSIIFREQCEYCLTSFSISGHLILTKESLLFEPDLRDHNVIINGYGTYQIFIDLCDIYECAHIVVPTKNTYLCINDDICGFVQVLLKSKYHKEVEETNIKKTVPENETNKNKGGSYYKYISKSLSFVYNLAHPLVQSSVSRDDNNKIVEHPKNEIDLMKKLNETCPNIRKISKSLEMSGTNTGELSDLGKKSDTDTYSSFNLDTSSNSQNISSSGKDVTSSNITISNESKNDGSSFNNFLENNGKHTFLNFNADAKKNVVKHLKDNDLKIYQKINKTNYADMTGTLPVITYKNNLSTLNSKSFSKDSSLSDIDMNAAEGEGEGEEDDDKKENEDEKKNKEVKEQKKEKCLKEGESGNNSANACDDVKQTCHSGSEGGCDILFPSKIKESVKNEKEMELLTEYDKRNKNADKKKDSGSTKKGTLQKTNDTMFIGTHGMLETDKKKQLNLKTGIKHAAYLSKHKSYEEKSFVLFRFFDNARAYETTMKIIKEIDEVRKLGKQMKKTITSVPFTSNELLNYIIEQSLKKKENAKMEKNNLKICDDKSDKTVSSNKSNYTGFNFNNEKEQKYQVIDPKLEYIDGAVKLLNKCMSKQINYYLPPTISIKIWKLAFCTSIHGISFKTLYRNVKNKGYVLLIICDMNNILFGYFADRLVCDNCYYGSGENFLFTFLTDENIKEREKMKQNSPIVKNDEMKENSPLNSIKEKHKSLDSSITCKGNLEDTPNLCVANEKIENDTKNVSNASRSASNSNYSSSKSSINMKFNNIHNNLFSNVFRNTKDYACREKEISKEEKMKNRNKQNQEKKEEKNIEEHTEKYKPIKFYPWTTKNNYFMYSDEKSIIIGGGDSYALIINEDLYKGQTSKSSTYDNDLLTLDEEFEIQHMQVWVFQDY